MPFNFGMNYDAWVNIYSNDNFRGLCPSDPATWSKDEKDTINKQAQEEIELCDHLMSLSDEDFYAEVRRLEDVSSQSDEQ